MKFLTAIDLTTNEIQNVALQNLASAPSSPGVGRIYYNTTSNAAQVWNGVAWVTISDAWLSSVTPTAPITATISGGVATIGITAATGSAAGSMSAADKAKLDAATNVNTASTLVFRDTSGNFSAGTITAALAGNASSATNASNLNGQAPSYYLSRANMTGTQVASTISDLQTVVTSYTLDTFAAPLANVSMNANKIINVADPTNAQDAATKNYVDSVAQGLVVKEAVEAASTANVTISGPGTAIDGYTLATGDRVLLKNQTTASENGIYIFNGSASAMTRAPDAATNADIVSGMFTFVENGTANATTSWILTTPDPITVGTTALTFAQFSGAGTYTAGAGLTLSGTTFAVGAGPGITVNASTVQISASYSGQTSITTLGTITGGVWNATTIGVAYGGTGATTASGARVNLGATGKFSASIGDGTTTSFVVNHNLNTQDIVVMVRQAASPYSQVIPDVEATTVSSATIVFATAPTTNQYRVVVVG